MLLAGTLLGRAATATLDGAEAHQYIKYLVSGTSRRQITASMK